jgi:hypothetical protein
LRTRRNHNKKERRNKLLSHSEAFAKQNVPTSKRSNQKKKKKKKERKRKEENHKRRRRHLIAALVAFGKQNENKTKTKNEEEEEESTREESPHCSDGGIGSGGGVVEVTRA